MTVHGHVRNGVIVLDSPTALPEGVAVEVRVMATTSEAKITAEDRPILKFSGIIKGMEPDASRRVDEILYGAPRE